MKERATTTHLQLLKQESKKERGDGDGDEDGDGRIILLRSSLCNHFMER